MAPWPLPLENMVINGFCSMMKGCVMLCINIFWLSVAYICVLKKIVASLMMHLGITNPSMSLITTEENQENSARPRWYKRETCIYLRFVGQIFTFKIISVSNFNIIDICQVVSQINRPDWWLCDVRISGVGTTTSKQVGIVIAINSQTGRCVTPLWRLPCGIALCDVQQGGNSRIQNNTHPEVCAGIILCMRPANERRLYIVTSSLIGLAHSQNNPWWATNYVVIDFWTNVVLTGRLFCVF